MALLTFHNFDAVPKVTMLICERRFVPRIMAWYGAYHSGDRYTVTVDEKSVRMDVNGEPYDPSEFTFAEED